jgi:hypothetical protein
MSLFGRRHRQIVLPRPSPEQMAALERWAREDPEGYMGGLPPVEPPTIHIKVTFALDQTPEKPSK